VHTQAALDFYRSPGPMSALPNWLPVDSLPTDLSGLREVVQGLVVHRDWLPAYGIPEEDVRLDEQHLRTTIEVLDRARDLSPDPITTARKPTARVQGICRHFALLYTAFLRTQDVPARVRCGFARYFERPHWGDHWITERWDGHRWVRDDPQMDTVQIAAKGMEIDPYDQPPGYFLDATQAWQATRSGQLDPDRFGIFDMWGQSFIAGNVLFDLACLNKVELLPWDGWGMGNEWDPFDHPITDDNAAVIDDLCAALAKDDFDTTRQRYLGEERLRAPPDITTFIDGEVRAVHLIL
jgi:hypothetical protein